MTCEETESQSCCEAALGHKPRFPNFQFSAVSGGHTYTGWLGPDEDEACGRSRGVSLEVGASLVKLQSFCKGQLLEEGTG